MRPRRHLVIFARAPALGRGKRRLAADIGALAALRFQRTATGRLLRRLASDRRWRCWLAVTPDRAAAGPGLRSPRCCRIAQGGGDLGQRMARPFARRRGAEVVLIGADIPDVAASHIAAAFRLLGASDLVLGPARDGGFWLIAGRRLPRGLFAGVRWSSEHALADTLRNAPRRCRVAMAETLDDIDDGDAYRRWLRRSANAP